VQYAEDKAEREPELSRSDWMSVLAMATRQEIEASWEALAEQPGYELLRPAEHGLIMVQARTGGTGNPFCLGEVMVTRCAVQLRDGTIGQSYVQGRDARHAELAAVFDALLCRPADRRVLLSRVIERLRNSRAERRASESRKVAATKVDFQTLVKREVDAR
jgi:alpha-D-ribose 1-methylphosphonate 5-triphosphate synthase subunit PhnG